MLNVFRDIIKLCFKNHCEVKNPTDIWRRGWDVIQLSILFEQDFVTFDFKTFFYSSLQHFDMATDEMLQLLQQQIQHYQLIIHAQEKRHQEQIQVLLTIAQKPCSASS